MAHRQRYIVLLTDNGAQARSASDQEASSDLKEYSSFNGYSDMLTPEEHETLKNKLGEEVELIVPDSGVEIQVVDNGYKEEDAEVAAQTHKGTSWGLQRITQQSALPDESDFPSPKFTYTPKLSGNKPLDVNVYVIDTGIYIDHDEFRDNRASWGKTFPEPPDGQPEDRIDGNGHGTHVAATIAGIRWGIATNAKVIAVKVFDHQGKGATSNVIAGIDWAVRHAKGTGIPSVINMSLGGGGNRALDMISQKAVQSGIHVCVAAGNGAKDVGSDSPANAPEVITVGATNIRDEKSDFSNWGHSVDVFAPGEHIFSAGKESVHSSRVLSGTSMATPHVAGVVAFLLGQGNQSKPRDMLELIRRKAAVVPLAKVSESSPNLLLQA